MQFNQTYDADWSNALLYMIFFTSLVSGKLDNSKREQIILSLLHSGFNRVSILVQGRFPENEEVNSNEREPLHEWNLHPNAHGNLSYNGDSLPMDKR